MLLRVGRAHDPALCQSQLILSFQVWHSLTTKTVALDHFRPINITTEVAFSGSRRRCCPSLSLKQGLDWFFSPLAQTNALLVYSLQYILRMLHALFFLV